MELLKKKHEQLEVGRAIHNENIPRQIVYMEGRARAPYEVGQACIHARMT